MDSFFGIGLPEFVLILVIAGMVMGPERIVRMARSLGVVTARLQNISRSFLRQLSAELDSVDDTGALRSTAEELKQLKQQVADLRDEVLTLAGEGIAPPKGSKVTNAGSSNSIMPRSLPTVSSPNGPGKASSDHKAAGEGSPPPTSKVPAKSSNDSAAVGRVPHPHQLPRRVDIPEDPDA
ncbi:MAG TPA: twin-arginine translocase TatA/TatE family subunit [Promineifilum sp.]|nr:twin-arginine translocase TatA/TatE family subunit [Promineifilum sp.]HRO23377.1 twin-arginine translocase TatA/TatE family subunit [Promineifilum sp.]HRO91616.1 twin-arginine translocase TatA/TatE family subunit [Promineifilum sp.]HRQ12132.1 twin-arginine translocase TatA/TatE family subunit [Promineifilum sp.]